MNTESGLARLRWADYCGILVSGYPGWQRCALCSECAIAVWRGSSASVISFIRL